MIELLKVTSFYSNFLHNFYAHRPWLVLKDFDVQRSALMYESYSWADHFSQNLKKLGIGCEEVVFNALPLNRAWQKKTGQRFNIRDPFETLESFVKVLKPRFIFFQDAIVYNGDFVRHLKEKYSFIEKTFGWCCVPRSPDQLKSFEVFDALLTCTEGYVERFKTLGYQSHLIRHAFEPKVIERVGGTKAFAQRPYPFVFSGSLFGGSSMHDDRIHFLKSLHAKGIQYKAFINPPHNTAEDLLKEAVYELLSSDFRLSGLRKALSRIKALKNLNTSDAGLPSDLHTEKPLFGLDMFRLFNSAQVTFNFHIGDAGSYAGNSRLFEATGMGSCLLTDHKQNLHELFEIDREIVSYKSLEECTDKALYLLRSPGEAEKIAQRGQARTLKDHNFFKRAQEFSKLLT